MKKQYVAVAVFVLTVLAFAFLAASLSGLNPFNNSSPTPPPTQTPSPPTSSPTSTPKPSPTQSTANGPTTYTYKIVKTYPHNTTAFTEGLVFDNSVLYESTGTFESSPSSLRQVNLENGVVQKEIFLSSQYFGEGLTVVDGSIVQLTWQSNIGFVYDKETFGLLKNFSYSTEGWGLTYNGNKLIMSDGSANLYFLDSTTFQKTGQVSVHDGNTSITNINELEYVNGDVYANIWLQQKIAIINPQNGGVKGWIDLTGIYQSNNLDEVLNGIAYDSATGRLFVTGKDWPSLYQITITPKT
jgi:glutaminyl-peptide cyclotransferase